MLLLKIEGKKEDVNLAVELARSYGFLPAFRSTSESGAVQVFMNFGGFGGEVGLIGSKDYVTDDFRKALLDIYKTHKDLYVALVDKTQAENKTAVVEFNDTDFDIEIELKEGTVLPLKAHLSVTAHIKNKSEKTIIFENINREFIFSLSVRDVADNELLTLAGNKLESPATLTLEPGNVYTESITFNISVDTPMCAKLVFQTITFTYNGNPTFYTMTPIFVVFK